MQAIRDLNEADDWAESGPALSWILGAHHPPVLHFLPTFWAMAQTVAVMQRQPSAQDMILNALVDLITERTVSTPHEQPSFEFGWKTYGDDSNEALEAMLIFHTDAIPTISDMWQESIDDTQNNIAVSLIDTIQRMHGPVGHA